MSEVSGNKNNLPGLRVMKFIITGVSDFVTPSITFNVVISRNSHFSHTLWDAHSTCIHLHGLTVPMGLCYSFTAGFSLS